MMEAMFLCLAPAFYDGDNIRCGGRSMRLARIDAPEFKASPKCRRPRRDTVCDDAAATASRDHLRRITAGARVTCVVVDASPLLAGFQATDRYGRAVVRCDARGTDLGRAQLAAGHAVRW